MLVLESDGSSHQVNLKPVPPRPRPRLPLRRSPCELPTGEVSAEIQGHNAPVPACAKTPRQNASWGQVGIVPQEAAAPHIPPAPRRHQPRACYSNPVFLPNQRN